MKIRKATQEEISVWLEKEPSLKNVIWVGENTLTLFAFDENDRNIAFLFAFHREIEAPLNGKMEWFINVIDVTESVRGQGIGSALIQEIIEIAKETNTLQVRAYCDIQNVASHMLWLKNGFGISPVKVAGGQIPGSFVTYRIL
jgi:Predicted P-loop ATPase fused to an acetyltransferase